MGAFFRTGACGVAAISGMLSFCSVSAAPAPVVYRLISCRSPANDMCRTEAEFAQPQASGKCEAARRTYLAAHKDRSAVCLKRG